MTFYAQMITTLCKAEPKNNMHGARYWISSIANPSEIPVVIPSSSRLEEDQRRALSLGAQWFIPKPSRFGMEAFLA